MLLFEKVLLVVLVIEIRFSQFAWASRFGLACLVLLALRSGSNLVLTGPTPWPLASDNHSLDE